MALTLKQWIDEAVAKLTESINIGYDMADMLDWAGISLQTGNPENAGTFLRNAADYMQDYCKEVTTRYSYGYYRLTGALYWIEDNFPEPVEEYELTWQKICEAWIKNDFEGRAFTIATIDRMRQILWDEPFFVAWAARPEEQEF